MTNRMMLVIAAIIAIFWSTTASQATRKAFVVGIRQYPNFEKVTHAVDDATKIADDFKALGYETMLITDNDATRTKFLKAWQQLLNGLKEGDDVVLFYSGHGAEVEGTNYIVPIDTPSADDLGGEDILKQVLISAPSLLKDLKKKNPHVIVWILDACRDNPFKTQGKSLGDPVGLTVMAVPGQNFIFYSADYGQKALDHLPTDPPTELNSVYTRTFLKMFSNYKVLPVYTFARTIRPRVRDLAKPHEQRPTYYDGLDDVWCFATCIIPSGQTTFQTAGPLINNPSASDISKALGSVFVDAVFRMPPNAVFLGKKSAAEGCAGQVGTNFPFGCALLNALLPNGPIEVVRSRRREFIGTPLKPQIAVDVRLRAPTLDEKIAGVFTCVVDTLTPKSTVRLSGILEVAYTEDTFYWGTLEGEAKDCRNR